MHNGMYLSSRRSSTPHPFQSSSFHNYKRIYDISIIYVFSTFTNIYSMHEEQFNDFEQATYNSTPTSPQANLTSALHSSAPLINPGLNQEIYPLQIDQPFSSLSSNADNTSKLDSQFPAKNQSLWPQLIKVNSAQAIADSPIIFDSTKTHSLKEQTNHSNHQQVNFQSGFFANQTKNDNLFPTHTNNQFLNQQSVGIQKSNTNFLLDLTSHDGNHYIDNQIITSSNMNHNQVNSDLLPESTNRNIDNKNSQHPSQVITTKDYLFQSNQKRQSLQLKSEQNKIQLDKIGSQFQASNTLQEPYNNLPFNYGSNQQNQVLLSTVNNNTFRQEQGHEIMDNTSQFLNTALNGQESLDINFQNKVSVKVQAQQASQRKQSEQFEFHEAKHQQVGDIRKQSQQFVFQTSQNQHSVPLPQQEDLVKEQLPQTTLNTPQTISNQVVNQNQINHLEQAVLPENTQDDDDDFGDFEETTAVANSQNQQQSEGFQAHSSNQENRVEINQSYLKSDERQYYQAKEKELQQFVNSLPDYSFLFAKAFVA